MLLQYFSGRPRPARMDLLSTSSCHLKGGIPLSVSALSPAARDIHKRVKEFIKTKLTPREKEFQEWFANENTRWKKHPILQDLKEKAKSEGLWNLAFAQNSPGSNYGAGLTNVEYAYVCEEIGRCSYAPEIFNCGFPGVPDMEIFIRFGSDEQKERWLKPMLNGEIGSCFAMTEPEVASSDANNISSPIRREGDHYIINGHKWWISGAKDPICKFCIFMGKTNPEAPTHKQHSMVVIPLDTPGFKIIRHQNVFGFSDAPHGHCELILDNVRVPVSNLIYKEGAGFEVAQGRLAPARVHHCMRLIGSAQRALEIMIDRAQNRIAFGKPLASYSSVQQDIARSRIEIEQCRLLILKAAQLMDKFGNKAAMPLISMMKVAVPTMTCTVVDRAIQIHGGMGVCQDTPLPKFYSWARVMRIADGPDEVHRQVIARNEFKAHGYSKL